MRGQSQRNKTVLTDKKLHALRPVQCEGVGRLSENKGGTMKRLSRKGKPQLLSRPQVARVCDFAIVRRVRPRQGTEICNMRKVSALDFLNSLQWIFPFSPDFLCNLVRKSAKTWRKLRDFRAEKQAQNPVKSLAVNFFRQEKRAQRLTFWVRRPPGGVGSSTQRGGGRKVRGMSREFCRDVPDP